MHFFCSIYFNIPAFKSNITFIDLVIIDQNCEGAHIFHRMHTCKIQPALRHPCHMVSTNSNQDGAVVYSQMVPDMYTRHSLSNAAQSSLCSGTSTSFFASPVNAGGEETGDFYSPKSPVCECNFFIQETVNSE